MANKSGQDLVNGARSRAGYQNTQFVTDAEVLGWINAAREAWYDLQNEQEESVYSTPYNFQLPDPFLQAAYTAAGLGTPPANYAMLPVDCDKIQGLDWLPDGIATGVGTNATTPVAVPSLLPIPAVSTPAVVLTGVLKGNHLDNARQMFWQWKEYMKTVGWFVVQSYDASGVMPAPGVDSWTDFTKLLGTGGGGVGDSWMVVQHAITGVQYLWNIAVTGSWLEVQTWMSPDGGFTGGTTGAPPTAPHMMQNPNAGYIFGTGPAGNQQFFAVCWNSSDGAVTRVAWVYGGHVKMMWEVDQLVHAPSGWTKNFLFEAFAWGNTDVTVVGNRIRARVFFLPLGSAGTYKSILAPGPDTVTAVEGCLDSTNANIVVNIDTVANPSSGQFLWIPARGISNSIAPTSTKGFWGYRRDEWWVSDDTFDVFNDFDTMGDNRDFIIIGQRVLQWNGSDPSALFGISSLNYPTAKWYGRNVS